LRRIAFLSRKFPSANCGPQAGVSIKGFGKRPGQTDAVVELADSQQPGVAGELTGRRFDDQRGAEKVEDL
jgi:hypothetical protein